MTFGIRSAQCLPLFVGRQINDFAVGKLDRTFADNTAGTAFIDNDHSKLISAFAEQILKFITADLDARRLLIKETGLNGFAAIDM